MVAEQSTPFLYVALMVPLSVGAVVPNNSTNSISDIHVVLAPYFEKYVKTDDSNIQSVCVEQLDIAKAEKDEILRQLQERDKSILNLFLRMFLCSYLI